MKKTAIIWVIALALVVVAIATVKMNPVEQNIPKQNAAAPAQTAEQKQENASVPNDTIEESEKKLAPDFTLKDLEGKEVSLKNFRGKNVYLNFWATWCPPCKKEMPDIEKLYQETKDGDLVILTVNIGENKETVSKFMKDNGFNFKVLLDTETEVAASYGISSIPVSLFIDKEGYVVTGQMGAMSLEQMKSYIETLNK